MMTFVIFYLRNTKFFEDLPVCFDAEHKNIWQDQKFEFYCVILIAFTISSSMDIATTEIFTFHVTGYCALLVAR